MAWRRRPRSARAAQRTRAGSSRGPSRGYLRGFSPRPALGHRASAPLPRSLRKEIAPPGRTVTVDQDFAGVIRGCAESAAGPGVHLDHPTTWWPRTRAALRGLRAQRRARLDGLLVGGLYSVARRASSAKVDVRAGARRLQVAFATLLGHFRGVEVRPVDCQTKTAHLQRFGAVAWRRSLFSPRSPETQGAPRPARGAS